MATEALIPRPRFLSRGLDSFSDEAVFDPRLPTEDPSEVLRASGKDAELWREMRRTELVISSAVALRAKKAASHGAGFVAGKGERAELYRRVAEGVWDVPQRNTVELEVIRTWACGFTVHEAVGTRTFAVDGQECLGPRRIYRRPSSHYQFTVLHDLVLLAGGERSDDRVFRTESVEGHRDGFKWLVSSWGDSGSPYGDAVLGDLWIAWRLIGEFWNGLQAGLLATNGILEVSDGGLSGTTAEKNPLSVEKAARNARETAKILRAEGILVSVGGLKAEIHDSRAAAEAWIAAIREIGTEMRRRILGSETPQAAPAVGSFALAKVQDEAPEAFGRFDVDTASGNITSWVRPWVRANFPNVDISDDEMPTWLSSMGRTPSVEHVQAAVAGGLPVDGREVAERWGVPLVEEDPEADLVMSAPAMTPRPDESEEEAELAREQEGGEDEEGDEPEPLQEGLD
jgi:hypothetical protein